MKNLFTKLLLLIDLVVFSKIGNSTTYYFSTTDGDDSRTSAQAQNSSTPWKTINKLNSFFSSLQPGDQILFKRGDVFYGSIIASKSGTSASPIVFDAYGSGAAPVITGLTTISSWTSAGNGLYQATISGGLSTLNIVTFDGAFQAMGKMPKGNKGYYTISSAGSNSVTSSGISGLPSYVGGEICWRPYHWVLWRGTITSQSSTTVNYTPFTSTSGGSTENPQANYGFFFQNAPAACTQLGEWAYNGSTHVITMYFGSDNPSNHQVGVPTIDNLVTSSATANYLTFNNLALTGANSYVVDFVNCSNIKINACNISLGGIYGIYGNGTATNWAITNNTITYCNSIGILASSSGSAWTVSGNTISNIATVAGMGGSGENQYFGMKVRNSAVVSSNTIKNIGYIPLMFLGTGNLIQNNVIDSFGFVKDDAGGIYTDVDNLSGSKIVGNIVTHGIGCPTGTPDKDMRAQGIYIDDGASNVEISGNTAAYCGRSGLYIHNAHDLNIHDNTMFDNGSSSIAYYNDGNSVANVTYQNNINFAKTASQLVFASSGGSNSATSFFGTLDNNYYCRPINESSDFQPAGSTYNLASWKSFVGKDANSKATPKTISDTSQLKFFYNTTSSSKTFSFGATYVDARGTSYSGTITLQPYTSAALVYVSGTVSNQAPVANAGLDQNLTLPTNSTTLHGSGTDADGSIASYAWAKISGPGQYTIASPSQAQTALNNLVQGIYQFELTVTDNQGATGKDTVMVTVNAAQNQAPLAHAGSNQVIVLPTNSATLDGSTSLDPDGSISAYNWSEISGPSSAAISNPAAATTSVGSLIAGVYQFQLTVTDNQGATGKDTLTITVNTAPNIAPVANAGLDVNITLPVNSVILSGTGSDADGTVSSYQWSKISGPSQYTIVAPSQAQTTINNLVQGVYQFAFKVTDNQGASTTDTVMVAVNAAPNQPPVADAGPDITISLPTNSATLNGNGSDADGTVVSYQWTKISGPSQYTLSTPTRAKATASSLAQGVYQFELAVTDNQGAIGRDTMVVTVNAAAQTPNQSPIANAGPDISITLPSNSVALNGSGTDPDGTVVAYQWTEISGPADDIVSPTQARTTVTNLVAGVYLFQLTVTDDQGATGSDTVQVVVNGATNQPPTASAGLDINVTLPSSSVILNGSGSDPDGTIASYQWTKISGPAQYTIMSPTQAQTAVSGLVQGQYQFALTVTDNMGATGTDTVIVNVNAVPNQSPVANAGADITITLPLNSVTLNGSGSDADGTIASYQWRKISGPSQYGIVSPTLATTTVNKLVQGSYKFELTVTDNMGATGRDTILVTVNSAVNQPPKANAGPDITMTLPTNSATLNGSGTDPDGTIASYRWTKISGPSQYNIRNANQAKATVTSLVQGVYQLQLKVTDNQGASASDTVVVTVNAKPANQSPKANAGGDITITLPVNSTTLSGSGSDADGTIASYQWTKISGPSQYTIVSPGNAQTALSNLAQGIYQFELKVTDNQGATGRDTVLVTVKGQANQSPVSNAGTDITITLPVNSVTLNGSGSDVDGTIASYQWTKISGPTQFAIVNPTQGQTAVNNLVQGVYQFELKVTDNLGASDVDTVQVTVNPATQPDNQPPVANAGSDLVITLPTDSVTLSGAGNDPDGTISSYQWTMVSGPAQYTIATPGQSQTKVNGLVEGVYEFELRVTDNSGASATDTVQVTVNAATAPPADLAPLANAGPDVNITLPENTAILAGSAIDSGGTISSYQWTRISGPTQYSPNSMTDPQLKVTNLVAGQYQFELKVTNNSGKVARDTAKITVNDRLISRVKLYPNPATNILNVQISSTTKTTNTTLSIYDSKGNIVYHENFVRADQMMTKQVNVNSLMNGVYYVELNTDANTIKTLMFVKQ